MLSRDGDIITTYDIEVKIWLDRCNAAGNFQGSNSCSVWDYT
jgi:hypothetical protein